MGAGPNCRVWEVSGFRTLMLKRGCNMTQTAKRISRLPVTNPDHSGTSKRPDAAAAVSSHEQGRLQRESLLKGYRQDTPVLVKSIRLQLETDGMERVDIELDRYRKPVFMNVLEGYEPKVSVALKGAKLDPCVQKIIHAGGRFLLRVRIDTNGTANGLGIILDLSPHSNCQVCYTHCLGTNLLRIDLSDDHRKKT